MTFQPGPRHPVSMPFVTPYADTMAALDGPYSNAAPSSGSWPSANRAFFFPIYLLEPFTVSKAFVCNGATVGTDSWDLGVYRMRDQSTGDLDLLFSTGQVLSAGTANRLAETATFKTARTNLTNNQSSTDADTYVTASVTLKKGWLYCMAVENSHASSAPAVSSIDGGPTFTSRATVQYNGTLNRVSLWTAVPTVDYTGTLTINFGASSGVTGAIWSLEEMSGVDTATNDGIVQTATGTGNSTTPLATLAAFGSANNATYGVQAHAAATGATAGTGFTELMDQNRTTPAGNMSTEWRVDNDTTVDATITSAQWGMIAAEIKASSITPIIPPARPGETDIYMAMVCNGLTATFLRGTSGPTASSGLGMLFRSSSFPLPSTAASPLAHGNNTLTIPLAGFSDRSLVA